MLLKKLTIDKLGKQLANQRVLMRVDFNVPIKNGKITDETRIKESLQTINYAYEQGARSIVLLSHMGRPNGEKNLKYSLEPIAPVLSKHLGKDVEFVNDCVGQQVVEVIKKLKSFIFL